MTPELRFLIYSSIVGAIIAALSYAAKKLFDWLTKDKPSSVAQGQAITDLADAMVDVSTKAVTTIRGELAAARDDLLQTREELRAARDELRATKRTMEQREAEHETVLGKMRRRIAQLVKVLTDNKLDVPDEED